MGQLNPVFKVVECPAFPIAKTDVDEFLEISVRGDAQTEFSAFYSRSRSQILGLARETDLLDSYLVSSSFSNYRTASLRVDRKPLGPLMSRLGDTQILDLRRRWQSEILEPFESTTFFIPFSVMDQVRDEHKAGNHQPLKTPRLIENDLTIYNLSRALVPAMRNPNEAGLLFIEHLFWAVTACIARHTGLLIAQDTESRGGLAGWQEKRAKALMLSRLCEDVSLKELAQECDLSPSYFSRAFKISTGTSPHRWLTEQRIHLSKEYMTGSDEPLSAIALLVGFSDQSHFTRIFSKIVGLSPGAWRRIART